MVDIVRMERKAAVLAPSALPCLAALPTVNLTAGCLHTCAYCYGRGYSGYPGDARVVLYDNTLEKLKRELAHRRTRPRAVYFSPSSDPFQPATAVVAVTRAVFEYLLESGVGVAFLTKGVIPDDIFQLLAARPALVRAQIGITTLDEVISRAFEPYAATPAIRLAQIQALTRAVISTEARLDPMLPGLTDAPQTVDDLFAALADVGVTRAAASVLFLRPAIVQSLKKNVADKRLLAQLLSAYEKSERLALRGNGSGIQALPLAVRRGVFDRLRERASAHGIELRACGCKNPDLTTGSCNIAGKWPPRSAEPIQPQLIKEED
jgi:DNA repair photolyase